MGHGVTGNADGADSADGADGAGAAELISAPFSVRVARHMIGADLAGRGLPARMVDDALVVVSELMANAIRHARPLPSGDGRGIVRLRWQADQGWVRIEVTDGGGDHRPHMETPSPVQTTGRGLAIVDAVASDWGVRDVGSEVTVYAVVGE